MSICICKVYVVLLSKVVVSSKPGPTYQSFNRLMLEVVPRLENRRMHLLHRHAQLRPKPIHNVPLPRIVLGIDPRLDLLIVDDTHAEALLRLGRVERRSSFLDLSQELLPVRERVSEAVEHVFGFKVPKRLEL